ncbi:hypothetical protein [Caulobacter sp. FWC2]|uniref:hypothetical protein n=1 Tax=Caulobacter sp. FWC2 TaxID=69664 RepID=UPI000C15DF64|nr:hypothetical protein [Caulobacter sp. FWC2]PIB91300.1 hypothetical protein CSW62_06745 [Caulobacter sp. FWC2]
MGAEVSAGKPSFIDIIIPAGASISDGHRINGKMVGLAMPAAWTTAAITFQGGHETASALDIYDDGVERTIPSAQAVVNRALSLDLNDWLPFSVIRIRSGTSAAPVNQVAEAKIRVFLAG